MADVTSQMITELRQRTGAGFADCKKALAECAADMDKAIEYLRKKNLATVAKKSGSSKRERIKPKGDARYVKRGAKGQFKESDDVGRSQKADKPRKAKNKVKPGYGDQGDQKPKRH